MVRSQRKELPADIRGLRGIWIPFVISAREEGESGTGEKETVTGMSRFGEEKH